MEWSVSEDPRRFRVKAQHSDGRVFVNSVLEGDSEVLESKVTVELEGRPGRVIVEIDGSRTLAHVARTGDTWWVHVNGRAHEVQHHEQSSGSSVNEGSLKAPMPGTVLEIAVKKGQRVREGQHLMTLEAMKMEHKVLAPRSGEVAKINFSEGDRVDMGSPLVEILD